MVFRAGRFFAEPATAVFREAKFRQLLCQREMAKLGGDRQVVAESHAIIVGANDQAKRAILFLQRQPQFLPVIPHLQALAKMIFPSAIVRRRFGPGNDRLRAKLGAVLEFQTERRVRQHGFAIHLDAIIESARIGHGHLHPAARRNQLVFGGGCDGRATNCDQC